MCTMVAQPKVMPGSWDTVFLVSSDQKGGVPICYLDLRHKGLTCRIKSTPFFPTTPCSRIEIVLEEGRALGGTGWVQSHPH